jgi:hypothetical protein
MKLLNKSGLLLTICIMVGSIANAYAVDESTRTMQLVDVNSIINTSGLDKITLECDSVINTLTGIQVGCESRVSSQWDDKINALNVTFKSDDYNRPSTKGIYADGFKCHKHENQLYGFSGPGTPWDNPTDFLNDASYDVTDSILYENKTEDPHGKYVGGCVPMWLSGKLIVSSKLADHPDPIVIPIYLGYGYNTFRYCKTDENSCFMTAKSHYGWFMSSREFAREEGTTTAKIIDGHEIGFEIGYRKSLHGEITDHHEFDLKR